MTATPARSVTKRPPRGVWLLLAGFLAVGDPAFARCEDGRDLVTSSSLVRHPLACRLARVVRGAEISCAPPALPSCASALPDQLATLLLGDGAPGPAGTSAAALSCQRQIVVSGVRFVQKRLVERSRGQRASKAGRVLQRRIAHSCADAVVHRSAAGLGLPRVGGECADLLGNSNERLDTRGLSRCIRATLEGIVDDLAPTPIRPNVLLVVTDDQRADTIDFMPTTAALRDESILFANAFVTNPVCTPSRASILSGLSSRNNGVQSNGDFAALDPTETIAHWLDEAGYTTALMGKYLNNSELLGLTPPQGWDEWKSFLEASGGDFYGFRVNDNGVVREFDDGQYSTDWLAREANRFVRRHSSRPFFLMLTPFAPHGPAIPAHRHEGRFDDVPPHRPPSWFGDVAEKPAWVRFTKATAGPNHARTIDTYRQSQLETLLSVDEAIAQLLETLEKYGLTDNTVVVFTSDHGVNLGEHWVWGKFNPYEESIRVPFLLRYPRRYPLPQIRTELVLNLDLAPTFLDFAGLGVPGALDGASLADLIEDTGGIWRDDFLVETKGEFVTRASNSVRTSEVKYIDTRASAGVTEELYDLVTDPYERTNLATDPAYAGVLEEMRSRLEVLRAR